VFVNPPLLLIATHVPSLGARNSALEPNPGAGNWKSGPGKYIVGFTFAPASFKYLIGKELAVVGGIMNFTMPNDSETDNEDYLPDGESESETDGEDELSDDDQQSLSEFDPYITVQVQ
jgi:hypothetical protein